MLRRKRSTPANVFLAPAAFKPLLRAVSHPPRPRPCQWASTSARERAAGACGSERLAAALRARRTAALHKPELLLLCSLWGYKSKRWRPKARAARRGAGGSRKNFALCALRFRSFLTRIATQIPSRALQKSRPARPPAPPRALAEAVASGCGAAALTAALARTGGAPLAIPEADAARALTACVGACDGRLACDLIRAGASASARDGTTGRTPLHAAAAAGDEAMAMQLVLCGADCGAEDGEGRTPADVAQGVGLDDLAKTLRERAAAGKAVDCAPWCVPARRAAAQQPGAGGGGGGTGGGGCGAGSKCCGPKVDECRPPTAAPAELRPGC